MAISREKVEAFWAANDTNNDGELSVDEVKAALQSQSSQCQLSAEDVEVSLYIVGRCTMA